ncbi:MAG: AbiJ-NTD4 domain-containing protein [Candidatus Thorarchaeota archaeon]
MAKLRFSERKGYKAIRKEIQKEDLDRKTCNSLWNEFLEKIWYGAINRRGIRDKFIRPFIKKLWAEFFEEPIDTIPSNPQGVYNIIKSIFFESNWYEIFDFLEFTSENFPNIMGANQFFVEGCNEVLKRKLSAYRLVGNTITEISSEEEIAEIAEILDDKDIHKSIRIHIKTALKMLSDKNDPDYRNSIKESISAVESICKILTEKPKATLGEALKKIEEKVEIHPALKSGFDKLYGYASAQGGIRHSLLDLKDIDFEDAKFMLVSCSAFINYLKEKAVKAKIDLKEH